MLNGLTCCIEESPVTVHMRPRHHFKQTKTCTVVLFSIGGRRLAARIEEIGGVWPWTTPTLVPSRTAYVNAIARHGNEMLPVFDLAGKLDVEVKSGAPFCLVAKHDKGPLAICIDGEVPSVHNVEESSIRPAPIANEDIPETCQIGIEEIPVYSFKNIGAVRD